MSVQCISCRLGRHNECRTPSSINDCCCASSILSDSISNGGLDQSVQLADGQDRGQNDREGNLKEGSQLLDPKSTGRKRAARLYPWQYVEDDKGIYVKDGVAYIEDKSRYKKGTRYRRADCEWLGNPAAGGGKHPIQGCTDGVQECRHHGPDKDTRNNEEGNVHRICHKCHNIFHAANDADYDDLILTGD